MNNFGALFGKLIASPVGNNLENQEGDVRRVKGIFSNLGYYNRTIENGIIDQELDTAIHAFQKDKKLKIDGYMKPAGETERALIKLMIEKQVEEATEKKEIPPPLKPMKPREGEENAEPSPVHDPDQKKQKTKKARLVYN